MAVAEHTKELINKYPYYSEMNMCPLAYHGYKPTRKNIEQCIEDIKYEITVYPEHTDLLLDHINNLKKILSIQL